MGGVSDMSPTIRRLLALATFTGAFLASQVALTRVFSIMFWYHYSFLVLTVALLGLAVSGVALSFLGDRVERWHPDALVGSLMCLSGLLLALCFWLITQSHFSPMFTLHTGGQFVRLILVILESTLAYFAMGLTVGVLLRLAWRNVHRFYALDLVGSALGCLGVLVALEVLGGTRTLLACGAAMALAGTMMLWGRTWRLALSGAVSALLLFGLTVWGDMLIHLPIPLAKPLALVPPEDVEYTTWTSAGRVDVFAQKHENWSLYGLWGISDHYQGEKPERKGIILDAWAYTSTLKPFEREKMQDLFRHMPAYLAYRFLNRPEALVIGAGGGLDVRAGVTMGAKNIEAVEINRGVVRAITGPYREFSGDIYGHPQVRLHAGEGRHVAEGFPAGSFDLVQLSGVDTYAANQAGAFALTENFLYTIEAVETYLDRLRDGGILTLTRWYLPGKDGKPRFSLRLLTLLWEGMQRAGIEDPSKNLFFFRSGLFTVILARKAPFSEAQISRAKVYCRQMGFHVLYEPGGKEDSAYYAYARATDKEAFRAEYAYNIDPPTDDSPFFFEPRRWKDIFRFDSFLLTQILRGFDGQTILVLVFGLLLVLGSVLLLLPAQLLNLRTSPDAGLWRRRGYFFAVGLGFMLIEVSLSQRLVLLLGHPVYALSFVLFGLLFFAGIGSFLAERLNGGQARRCVLFLGLWIAVLSLVMFALAPKLIASPLVLRYGFSSLVVFPLGLMLGLPFPSALRMLRERGGGEGLVGDAWAFNGFASVLAGVLAVILAMTWGFSLVLFLAAGCYFLAWWLFPSHE